MITVLAFALISGVSVLIYHWKNYGKYINSTVVIAIFGSGVIGACMGLVVACMLGSIAPVERWDEVSTTKLESFQSANNANDRFYLTTTTLLTTQCYLLRYKNGEEVKLGVLIPSEVKVKMASGPAQWKIFAPRYEKSWFWLTSNKDTKNFRNEITIPEGGFRLQ